MIKGFFYVISTTINSFEVYCNVNGLRPTLYPAYQTMNFLGRYFMRCLCFGLFNVLATTMKFIVDRLISQNYDGFVQSSSGSRGKGLLKVERYVSKITIFVCSPNTIRYSKTLLLTLRQFNDLTENFLNKELKLIQKNYFYYQYTDADRFCDVR